MRSSPAGSNCRWLACGVLLAMGAAGLMHGCNIVGPIAVLASPPQTQDAEYKMADRVTAVYVDDRKNVLNDRGLRMFIGDRVLEHLMRNKVLKDSIKTSNTMAAAGSERAGALKPLEQIGREVGAAQLIYVEMLSFGLEPDASGAPRAQATLRVKLIDVENRVRLFPPTGEDVADARYMTVTLPPEQTYQPVLTRASQAEANRTLAEMIADRVAKLFYKWEVRPLGDNSAPKSAFD